MAVATMQHPPSHEQAPEYPAIKPGMMGMYIFLASEVMFFGSRFAMYFYLFGSHLVWPPPAPSANPEFYVNWWPIPFFNTIILLSSGVTCHYATEAIAHDNRRRFFQLQIATIILGVGFEIGQLIEFINAFGRGLDLKVNSFATAFFTMTCFHGAHRLAARTLPTFTLHRPSPGPLPSRPHA